MSSSTFNRVRTRADSESGAAGVDVQGKSALFSRDTVTPSIGSVVITCSACQVATRDVLRPGPRTGAAQRRTCCSRAVVTRRGCAAPHATSGTG